MTSSYEPNFSDPRIRRRCETALQWAVRYQRENKDTFIAQTQIKKYLGQHQLGSYLKGLLLITTDNHWNHLTGKCKQYRLNGPGVKQLQKLLGYEVSVITAQEEQAIESGNFVYKDQSYRLWTPIVFIPATARQQTFASKGYKYAFDIQCAAPTLLSQYACKINPNLSLTTINDYIRNRTAIRNRLATELQLSYDVTKEIINALLQGAKLSANNKTSIFNLINCDYSKMAYLKQDQYLTELRSDITQMWKSISTTVPKKTMIDKRGITRTIPMTSRDKAMEYLKLEREVLDVVRSYLKKKSLRVHLEHDGFIVEEMIDVIELQDLIRNTTGYSITYDISKL